MLKRDIIPELAKTYSGLLNAKVTWYMEGIYYTYANVKLSGGGVVEVIFNGLNNLVALSPNTDQLKLLPPKTCGPTGTHTDGTPCYMNSKEVCICELPF